MKNYQYQILRYIHDQVSGEFVNVGLVLYSEQEGFLDCRVVTKYSRISHFFREISGPFLLTSLKHFENSIKEIALDFHAFTSENDIEDITSITKYLLPKDDSALTITEMHNAIDLDLNLAFDDLYNRLIERYMPPSEPDVQTDQKAWREVYKKYFDSVGITGKLKKHQVKTKKDTIAFNQAWKNGVWNCYQPLSFDLKNIDNIKSKVYKWSGIIKELQTSNEPVNVYLLTTRPSLHTELNDFIQSTLRDQNSKSKTKVSVVTEDKAEDFAINVRDAMKKSKLL